MKHHPAWQRVQEDTQQQQHTLHHWNKNAEMCDVAAAVCVCVYKAMGCIWCVCVCRDRTVQHHRSVSSAESGPMWQMDAITELETRKITRAHYHPALSAWQQGLKAHYHQHHHHHHHHLTAFSKAASTTNIRNCQAFLWPPSFPQRRRRNASRHDVSGAGEAMLRRAPTAS